MIRAKEAMGTSGLHKGHATPTCQKSSQELGEGLAEAGWREACRLKG